MTFFESKISIYGSGIIFHVTCFQKVSKSFKNKAKRNGYKFSPCLTPLLHGENSDIKILYTIRDFVSLYIFTITLKIFPIILISSNLCRSPACQTVSNAFAKSTNTQYNFFFLFHHIFCSHCICNIIKI